MDKNKKKNRKFLLSLLILLCVGTVGTTSYALATGQLPPIINSVVKIFTGDTDNKASENVQPPAEINMDMENTSSEISPDGIEGTKSITHKEENSDDEFDEYGEYENDNSNSMYSNTGTEIDFESEPIMITTDTSQDTTSQPSIPAPTFPPTNNPPIPLPAPDVPAVNPKPNKPAVPPTDNKHTDDDTSSSARHRHKKPSISGVTLDKTEITLNKGDISSPLISTISPSNATGNKIIKWSSKDEAIATVDKDGHITAVGAGTTNIVATTSNGKTAECKVTVLVPPSGIKINSDNFEIDKGLSKTLTATVEPEDCTEKSVIWATSNNDVISVDDKGKITAVTPGTATITATTADGKFSSSCEVTVVISISKLELNKTETTLIKGTEETLTATITPPDTTENKKIQWISSNENICTVDENGKITAVNGGTATITAQVGSHVAECEVTVIVPVSGIEINKSELRLAKDTEETLTATVEPEDCTEKSVIWATSNSDVLSIDDNGRVTAVAPGTATITATTADGKFSSDCEVTVVISISKLELDKTETTLIKGTEETLTATINPPDTTEIKTVQWTSSDENICVIDKNGKITTVNGGTATITAQVGSHVAECEVTVIVPVNGVEINKSELRLAKDTEETLTANILPEDATDKAVEWSSSNPEIANVNENGKVTGIKVGTAVITVKTHDGGFTADCTVNVVIPVTGIKLDKTELSIIRKDTAVLIPTITPDNATDKSVIWSSSNENICTVDENGKVTGTGVGSTVIKSTSNDGGFTAECKVTVTPDEYTITANAENGKVVGAGTHHVGTDVTLNAVPDEHYHFVNWTYDGKEISTESEYLIKNLNEDISITANFEIDYHTVTVTAGDGGTVSGGGRFAYGTSIILNAVPNDKYEFVKWSDGNTESNRTYVVIGDESITANFKHTEPLLYETYSNGDGTCMIEKYIGPNVKELVIPEYINGEKVVRLRDGFDCFNGINGMIYNKSIKSVIIPNTVTSIGGSAFQSCTSLVSVTIPNSVKSIDTNAFFECTSLKSIKIPNSITSIGNCAFKGCISLTSISIPDSITSVGEDVFNGWKSSQTIHIYGKSNRDAAVNAWGYGWDFNVFDGRVKARIVYHG